MANPEPFEDDPSLRILIVKIGKSLMRGLSEYDATRGIWRVDINRAIEVDLVLGVANGVVRTVFVPVRWKDATREEFPMHSENPEGRYAFDGNSPVATISEKFWGKSLPERLAWRRGAANPVRYSW